mmetsp:Transcript_141596/g.452763  ORF Transcript_141596/g.452763 Transcript_141596/m.452763 type:complete len:87 (+) Transcript_141596:2742-3002(+)
MEIPGYMPPGGPMVVPARGLALRRARLLFFAAPFAFGAGTLGLVVFAARRFSRPRARSALLEGEEGLERGPNDGQEFALMGGEHAA